MMKRTRKLCYTLLILGFMLPQVMGSTADAASGTWKHNRKGRWYSYSDGSYAKNEWLNYGGKWYYFDSTGYMVTGWKKIDRKWYFFGTNGAMATRWRKIDGQWYYFGTNGIMVDGWCRLGRLVESNGIETYKMK